MKKLLLGSVSLLAFALSIAIVEISCQKSVAQVSTSAEAKNIMLYHTTKLVPVTYEISPATDTLPAVTRTESYTINTYYVADIDGNNEKPVPVPIPQNMYSGDYAKLTDDGSRLVFSLYEVTAPPTKESIGLLTFSIYSCSLDGSGLKKIKEGITLDDVH